MRLKKTINKEKNLSKKEKKLLIKTLNESNSPGGKLLYYILLGLIVVSVLWVFYTIYNFLDEIIGTTILARLRHVFMFISTMIVGFIILPIVKYLQEKIRTDSQAGYKMNINFKRPILFLRNFKSDVSQGIDEIRVRRNNYYFITETTKRDNKESFLIKDFKEYGPLIALKGYQDNSFKGASRFRKINENDWKELVVATIKISSSIVIMVGEITESLSWELHQLSKYKKKSEIFFFILPKTSLSVKESFFQEVSIILDIDLTNVQKLKDKTYISENDGCLKEINLSKHFEEKINSQWN
ncbi:hypothetical protein [Pareuzebyella sediminis]|uniref:hypothetical protein n=1 Tax=Pareuzebyella sediminis TaxID=2607998 RepID=UPI0011EC708D|nr:hypothetical protein [Pareuzebyella sediminis]